MQISTFLAPENALVDVEASDKARLLTELSARAARSLSLEHEQVSQEILRREELGSTGVGGGAAIPHARIPGLAFPFGILARLRKPIDFDAIDGKRVDVVFLLLLPASSTGYHLKVLAAVARALRNEPVLSALRHAEDAAGLYAAITSAT
jgi:PTS system nitrogen regulatory IIA component